MPDNRGGESRGELVIYQTEDSSTRVQVRLEDESVWMTQAAMADLFQTTPQDITIHLKAIFEEGELNEVATCKNYLQVQIEGSREVSRECKFYNLETILTVGCRARRAGGRARRMNNPFPATKPSPLGRRRGGAGVRGVEDRHV